MKKISVLIVIIANLFGGVRAETITGGQSPQSPAEATTPAKSGIVDDRDAGWIWSGMTQIDNTDFSHGSAHAGGPPTYAAYTFHGSGVKVVGFSGPRITVDRRTHKIGTAKISIDGTTVATRLMESSDVQADAVIYETSGLSDGNHVLQITPVDGWILIDYIDVRPAQTAHADTVKTPGTEYHMVSAVAPGKVLEVWPGAVEAGARLDIASITPDHVQTWRVDDAGDGMYRISPSGYPDLAVSIGPPISSGAVIMVLTRYIGDKTQKWAIAPAMGNYYRLCVSGDTVNCFSVLNYNSTDGALIFESPWKPGAAYEQWSFIPVNK